MHKTLLPFVLAASFPALSVAIPYTAELTSLNDSGVSGTAHLDLTGSTLTVNIQASGLEANQTHPQHIHGTFDSAGRPTNATLPTVADDTDGDGFIEVAEGAASYGPIIVPLTSPPGGAAEDFPTAPDGTINFTQVYDLSDSTTFAEDVSSEDLAPLDLREIVLHGLSVPQTEGEGTPGEVNGEGGYLPTLPVAAGLITQAEEVEDGVAVSLPTSLSLLFSGFVGFIGLNVARRRVGGSL